MSYIRLNSVWSLFIRNLTLFSGLRETANTKPRITTSCITFGFHLKLGVVSSLVVQTDPGPIPTLMMSAPAKTSASTMSPVTTFPAWKGGKSNLEHYKVESKHTIKINSVLTRTYRLHNDHTDIEAVSIFVQGSISSTFFARVFCTKVTFWQLFLVTFWLWRQNFVRKKHAYNVDEIDGWAEVSISARADIETASISIVPISRHKYRYNI